MTYKYILLLSGLTSALCFLSAYANSGVPLPNFDGVSLTNASLKLGEVATY